METKMQIKLVVLGLVLAAQPAFADVSAEDVVVGSGIAGFGSTAGSLGTSATVLSPFDTITELVSSLTPTDEVALAKEIDKELKMYDASNGKVIGSNMESMLRRMKFDNKDMNTEDGVAAIRVWVQETLAEAPKGK